MNIKIRKVQFTITLRTFTHDSQIQSLIQQFHKFFQLRTSFALYFNELQFSSLMIKQLINQL